MNVISAIWKRPEILFSSSIGRRECGCTRAYSGTGAGAGIRRYVNARVSDVSVGGGVTRALAFPRQDARPLRHDLAPDPRNGDGDVALAPALLRPGRRFSR